jgi:hypothetical protein
MNGRTPRFVHFWGSRLATNPWPLVMLPGLSLILFALAILIWPQLLAYMIATLILFAGITLTVWGWGMRQAAKRAGRAAERKVVYYEVQ